MPQPQSNPQPSGQDPYGFFMDENGQQKGKFGGLQLSDGSGPNKKLFVIVGILLILAFVGIMVGIVVGNNKKPIPLNGVVRVQQEVLIITADAWKNAKDDDIRNVAVTANSVMSTAQRDTILQVKKHGVKIGEKEIGAISNPQATNALAASIPANTYDSTFETIMKTELTKYDTAINASIAVAASKNELALLKKLKADNELLKKQLAELATPQI